MNYAMFGEWVRDRVDDLVRFGVPRDEAECLVRTLEIGAIAAEADARGAEQFLLDLRRIGTSEMAHRRGVTESAIRKQRSRYLDRDTRLRSEARSEA
jgi:hypothetical protein